MLERERGYRFKDIKPENIGIDTEFSVKIFDFGISQPKKGTQKPVGTKIYMSPEMRKDGMKYTNKTDIWPIGIIMADLIRRRLFNFVRLVV